MQAPEKNMPIISSKMKADNRAAVSCTTHQQRHRNLTTNDYRWCIYCAPSLWHELDPSVANVSGLFFGILNRYRKASAAVPICHDVCIHENHGVTGKAQSLHARRPVDSRAFDVHVFRFEDNRVQNEQNQLRTLTWPTQQT